MGGKVFNLHAALQVSLHRYLGLRGGNVWLLSQITKTSGEEGYRMVQSRLKCLEDAVLISV